MSNLTDNANKELSKINKKSWAWKLFNAFLEQSDLEATEEQLIQYAVDDLKVNLNQISEDLKENLTTLIIYFMNTWSGWQFIADYKAGRFSREHLFIRFHKFMTHKVTVTLRSQFAEALKLLEAEGYQYKSLCASTSGEPNNKTNLEFSPYCISIKCPPHMLNTLVFSNVGDDITMKQHLGINWKDLNPIQLLNWPYIQVTFKNDDIYFVRKQATEYLRYLNFFPHESKKTDATIVEHVEIVGGAGKKRACYSLDFLETYFQEYIKALKALRNITSDKVSEVQILLYQFLEDIRHIDVNSSIATNTKVLFRLSTVPFIRNKKLVKGNSNGVQDDQARVGYCEIIAPKVELTVHDIQAQQLKLPRLAFKLTEKIWGASRTNVDITQYMPMISYQCTFCQVEFGGVNARRELTEHLRREHKMEQHVRCTLCKKQFDVLSLAACRWKHKCVTAEKERTPSLLTVT